MKFTLKEFCEHTKKDISRFEAFWLRNQRENGTQDWPESMTSEEWHEQWVMSEGEDEPAGPFLVVGGPSQRDYRGSLMHPTLQSLGLCETMAEVEKLVEEHYDECSGLIRVFDTKTGGVV